MIESLKELVQVKFWAAKPHLGLAARWIARDGRNNSCDGDTPEQAMEAYTAVHGMFRHPNDYAFSVEYPPTFKAKP